VRPLEQSVLRYTRQHNLLQAGDRIGIAVSGGADSVALLRILLELKHELGIVLSAVHFNHKLRGAESKADERFVRELAERHNLPLISGSADVSSHAANRKLSIETAARELRYKFFENLLGSSDLDEIDLDKIATAHTLDDQSETVLLKLARGAGTRGLAGIYPKISRQPSAVSYQPKAIVRPLLSTRRSEIETYLREIDQDWREDSSNRDLRHTRNRIRQSILPKFEEQLNPGVRQVLAETAEVARAEEDFWTQEISRFLPQLWRRSEAGGDLDGNKLRKFPLAVQRRLIRAAGESLGLHLEFSHVEEVLSPNPGTRRASLPQGWCAHWQNGGIVFERCAKPATNYEYALSVPGTLCIPEIGLIIDALLPSSGVVQVGSNGFPQEECWIDLKCARSPVVRNWRAGDRFWPAHSKNPKKIKELLQDRRITGKQKKLWPVIANGNEILWVRGLGVNRKFQTKAGKGLLIRCSSVGDECARGH
jgi:tRNA(Ile)-lysidine synthase